MTSNGQHEHDQPVDVGAQRVARTYAEALLDSAEAKNQAGEVLDEFDSLVRDLFPADARLEAFLSSRAIGREKKEGVLRTMFGGRASTLFLNFLLVLNKHDRLDLVRAVLGEARRLYETRTGRVRVQVETAVPLAEAQRQRLLHHLRDSLHKEPVLETRVEPALLGGLVVRVGDWLYDASVRTRLDTLRNQMIERSSYEIQSRRDSFCTANGN